MAAPGNFDFLLPRWPAFHTEAKRVERDTLFDPLTTCIFARRTLEFVNLVIEYLTQHGDMDAPLLYEPPFTDLAPTGPEQLFPHDDVDRLVEALARIRLGAGVA